MKNSKYYVCKSCMNIIMSTGNAEVHCCGRKLQPLEVKKADDEHKIDIEEIENEWYLTSKHPMLKEHYISFAAFSTAEQLNLIKLYPEWDMQVRIPKRGHGVLLWYCTEHGLFYRYI